MKKTILFFAICLLLSSKIFALDLYIDSSGNISVGVENQDGKLEVTGSSDQDGIIGITSGNGTGVYGGNSTTNTYGHLGDSNYGVFGYSPLSGYAGYFDGDAKVTGKLVVEGLLTGPGVGDITSVTSGAGLAGGGAAGNVTLNVDFAGTGSADTAAKSDHNHDVTYSPISHSHSGNDISSGIISETYIDSTVARDSEIMTTVLANDGENSGLDADTLDGKDSSEIISEASSSIIPSGFFILGESTTPPSSYTFTGGHVLTRGMAWSKKTPMNVQRYFYYNSVVSAQNKIYVIGGSYFDGTTLSYMATVEEYDPATDTWTVKADLPTPRYSVSAVEIGGKILALGGRNDSGILSTVEEYDPANNTWVSKADMLTPKNSVRTALVNGKLYVIGGHNGSEPLLTVEVYDPSANTWALKPEMILNVYYPGIAAVNGKIYAIGGENVSKEALSTVEEYDLATDTWTTKNNMPNPRKYFKAVVVNGKIYAIGGVDSLNNNVPQVEEYDPVTDIWTPKEDIPVAANVPGVAAVSGMIYVMDYFDKGNGVYLFSNYEFNPSATTLYIHRKD